MEKCFFLPRPVKIYKAPLKLCTTGQRGHWGGTVPLDTVSGTSLCIVMALWTSVASRFIWSRREEGARMLSPPEVALLLEEEEEECFRSLSK